MMNVILISLDCVRPEALSCYPIHFPWWKSFPEKERTVNIDQIAKDGVLFTQAFCQAPFTSASHASILTGLNPYHHGIRRILGYKLADSANPLAEVLEGNGYRTAAFIGSHALSSKYGLNRGFDIYDEDFKSNIKNWILGYRRPGWEVTDKALEWLSQQEDKFFLFLHYFDAHDAAETPKNQGRQKPRRPLHLYRSVIRSIDQRIGNPLRNLYLWKHRKTLAKKNLYGIRYHLRKVKEIDIQIGKIVNFLERRKIYDETLIVIVADHGDAFGERGEFNHRKYLYDTTIKIPLIIKGTYDFAGKVQHHLVRSIDIYKTILEMLGIQAGKADGVSLLSFMRDDFNKDLKAYSETRLEISAKDINNLESNLVSLRTSEWKLIINQLNDAKELYNLKTDPGERKNIWKQHQDIATQLEKEIKKLLSDTVQQEKQMNREELNLIEQKLRSLGYL